MPIILRVRGYKFWFYEADLNESPHVHIGKEAKVAKYWLDPIKLARAGKFKAIELREIERIIVENQKYLMNVWKKEKSKHVDR
jgi:hypothetical protein